MHMGNTTSTQPATMAEKLTEKVQQVKEGAKDEITKRKISFLRKFDLPSTQLTNEQVQQMKFDFTEFYVDLLDTHLITN